MPGINDTLLSPGIDLFPFSKEEAQFRATAVCVRKYKRLLYIFKFFCFFAIFTKCRAMSMSQTNLLYVKCSSPTTYIIDNQICSVLFFILMRLCHFERTK